MLDELRPFHRRVPAWWADAKLGIFVHWVPASVPAFAPTDREVGELLGSRDPDPISRLPYSEWYQNALRFPDSPTAAFHREHYGDRPYERFADDFVAGLDQWDPVDWARRFAATGARYVVLVSKHHDGWCLWPTGVRNPHRAGWHSPRDLVGELADAVRAEGLRFGLYYSTGYDWTFEDHPIGSPSSGVLAWPGGAYPAYAEAHVRELIDRYRPDVLWGDIAWPGSRDQVERLLADYLRAVPDGVVNDRWMPAFPGHGLLRHRPVAALADAAVRRAVRKQGGLIPPPPPFFQHRTPEYTTFDRIESTPWECVRGMDRGFGYNRTSTEADHLTRADLLRSIVHIAATGGNLLLNVGPRGEDAQIPEAQLRRLDWLAAWSTDQGAGLGGTRPWVRHADRTPDGAEVRYTARGDDVWAWCWREGGLADAVSLPFRLSPRTEVADAAGRPLAVAERDGRLVVSLPSDWDDAAAAIRLRHAVTAPR